MVRILLTFTNTTLFPPANNVTGGGGGGDWNCSASHGTGKKTEAHSSKMTLLRSHNSPGPASHNPEGAGPHSVSHRFA